jgi:hypothetical protein
MQRLISAICAGAILGAGLVLAFAQPADDAQQKLQGTWTATKAERDGNAADDVVGHRLSFTGNRFLPSPHARLARLLVGLDRLFRLADHCSPAGN